MPDNKELIKKDLVFILRLNAAIHYDNPAEVKRVYDMVLQKKLFKTALGQKYVKRLEQMISKTAVSHDCVLCRDDLDNSSLICSRCLAKYKIAPAKKESNDRPIQKGIDVKQKISEISQKTVQALQIDKLDQSILKGADVRQTIFEISKKTTAALQVGKKATKKKFTGKIVIVLAVIFLLFAGVMGGQVSTSNKDLLDMMGMTEKQVERQYGKPDRVERSEIAGFSINKGYYNDGFGYQTDLEGHVQIVFLTSGARELAGVSIGDGMKEAVAGIEGHGGVFSSGGYLTTNDGRQIMEYVYKIDNYAITFEFDIPSAQVSYVVATY